MGIAREEEWSLITQSEKTLREKLDPIRLELRVVR